LFLILVSCLSGIFAGMGMGGGTFLIPLLSLVFGISQTICQSTNVICFVVLAIICFFVYVKEKLIDFFALVSATIPACLIAFFSSFFALKISSKVLKICFAVFIVCVGIFYFFKAITNMKRKAK
jgi:hypothetical protein